MQWPRTPESSYTNWLYNSWEYSKETFQQLLLEKITPSGNRAWTEQYFVIFVWTVTSTSQCAQQELDIIADIAKRLMSCGCNPLSEEACHASLTVSKAWEIFVLSTNDCCFQLVWKRIEHAIPNHDLCMAEQWCLVALEQPLFQNCSVANRDIFQRSIRRQPYSPPNSIDANLRQETDKLRHWEPEYANHTRYIEPDTGEMPRHSFDTVFGV